MSPHPPHEQPGWASPNHGQHGGSPSGAQPGQAYPGGSGHPGGAGHQWGGHQWGGHQRGGNRWGGGHDPWHPPEESPRRGRRRGLTLGIVAAVAVVAILTAGFWVVLDSVGEQDSTAGGTTDQDPGPAQEGSAGGSDVRAEAVVESYLTALAAGDFDEAFSYAQEDPRGGFLTEELINESLELAPVTNIDVEPVDADPEDFSDYVNFSYTIGDTEFHGEMYVVHTFSDDRWMIGSSGLVTQISPLDAGSLEFRLNGEPVPAEGVDVLYGLAYVMDVDHENFTLTHTDDDGVMLADDAWISLSDQEVALTEQAEERWRSAILEEAEACLESTTYEAGCGLDMPQQISGDEVIDETIERSASTSIQQTLQALTPRLDFSNPNLVAAEETLGGIDISYDCQGPSGSGRCEVLSGNPRQFDRPVIDMAAEELEVVWE